MAKINKPYRITLLSEQVQSLFTNWHNLRTPFEKWLKIKAARTVRFESTYKLKRIKKYVIYVEEIKDCRVTVVMPPLSDDPLYDYKVYLGANVQPKDRKRIKKEIGPIIRKFIKRNY